MDQDSLRTIEITGLHDRLLPPWLELYETSFPPTERVLVASFLRQLSEGKCGPSQSYHLLAAVDSGDALVAMACYEMMRDAAAACLWYLAVRPELRSRGIGSWCYRQVLAQAQRDGARAAMLEVEIPEQAHTDAVRRDAERRIEFYRRLGAKVLTGIAYTQSVGSHQAPIPMHLMLHAFAPMTAAAALALAKELFGDSLVQLGTPGLA